MSEDNVGRPVVTTDPTTVEMRRRSGKRPVSGLLFVGLAATVGVLLVWVIATYQGSGPRQLPGRQNVDVLTYQAGALLEALAWLSALAAFGLLFAAAVFSPINRSHQELSPQTRAGLLPYAGRAAQLWFTFAVLVAPFNAAIVNGVSVGAVIPQLGQFLWATPSAMAWLVTGVLALGASLLIRFATRLGNLGAALYLMLLATLPPVVTGNVTVGANHDWASDAGALSTVAFAILGGAALAQVVRGGTGTGADAAAETGDRLRRYQWISGIFLILAIVFRTVVAWWELAGTSPFATAYGWLLLGMGALALLLVVSLVLRRFLLHAGRISAAYATSVFDAAALALITALSAVTAWLAPPRFWVPQDSIQINYLGYSIDTPPSVESVAGLGRVNLLFTVIAVVALLVYWVAWWQARRIQKPYPISRLVCWTIGWGLVLYLNISGFWEYSSASFTFHMVEHMSINMLAPVLIVVGGPITLFLNVLPVTRETSMPRVRDAIVAMTNWKALKVILHPLVIGFLFVASLYVIYFSDLFGAMMRYHWAHQFMMLHYLIVGLLFYSQIIGTDKAPVEVPHVGRLGFMMAVMPFHAFFAVIIMGATTLVGEQFYRSLSVPWNQDLHKAQELGGQLTWAIGEIPMLLVILILMAQWLGSDQRDARRKDRAMDEGLDDSFDAYNEMLAELARREEDKLQK
ncbi:cytochrome c oxidase assembly protein [Granulicoccus phenolivorans]|uniref:cytochrome c oxidase assembly protein n=1 Tax=Granulicoccus phenolivorans TaxID=266854 RepID=UPI0006862E3A|nr:cytochrome c oxidase assembly protein [Granulicoccus phenolivorans]